uniref:Uncharacterized protein n=1 Tax=Glossina pallidipes TaxID=7398 RepID=A0A1B0A6B1_GLOPL
MSNAKLGKHFINLVDIYAQRLIQTKRIWPLAYEYYGGCWSKGHPSFFPSSEALNIGALSLFIILLSIRKTSSHASHFR